MWRGRSEGMNADIGELKGRTDEKQVRCSRDLTLDFSTMFLYVFRFALVMRPIREECVTVQKTSRSQK